MILIKCKNCGDIRFWFTKKCWICDKEVGDGFGAMDMILRREGIE